MKDKLIKLLLLTYSVLFYSTLILVSLGNLQSLRDVLLIFLFLPVLSFLLIQLIRKLPLKIKPSILKLEAVFLLYSFVFTSLIIVFNLLLIRSIGDSFYVLVFLPFEIYAWTLILPGFKRVYQSFKQFRKVNQKILLLPSHAGQKESIQEERKRQFLKIIGSTSLGLFILYMLNPKPASAAFFGSMPGPGTISIKDSSGNKIDPAIQQPLDGYSIANYSDSGSYPHYYGFLNKNGAWYVLKDTGDANGTFLYANGTSGTYNWANVSSLTYATFDTTF
ncbi:MAG TPA: hypothetical protein VMR41_02010 [Patescibacteria group bacterium]|nr:hypothetical protein [Patescibacteria group bacterium]